MTRRRGPRTDGWEQFDLIASYDFPVIVEFVGRLEADEHRAGLKIESDHDLLCASGVRRAIVRHGISPVFETLRSRRRSAARVGNHEFVGFRSGEFDE